MWGRFIHLKDKYCSINSVSKITLFFSFVFYVLSVSDAAATGKADSANHQKVFPVESEVYKAIETLSIARGLSLPSTSGPWTEDELLMMLSRFEGMELKEGEEAAFNFASRVLKREKNVVEVSVNLTPEVYAHTNTSAFVRLDDYIRPVSFFEPTFAVDVEAWLSPYGYGFFELPFGNNVYNTIVRHDGCSVGSTFFGETPFTHNIFMLPPAGGNNFDMNFPHRTVISFGGEGWNFIVGRDRVSWGPGESGNFLVGDHIPYHNMARTTFYNKALKWTFQVSSFPYPGNYYIPGDEGNDAGKMIFYARGSQFDFDTGINLFIAHRFEYRGLNNRLGFALSEAIMYQNADGGINPVVFLPGIVLHNLYITRNANSILSLEGDLGVCSGVNIYFEAVMDEFSLGFGENVPGKDDNANPNAVGIMAGVKTAFPLAGGLFRASLEGTATSPYLYLRTVDRDYMKDGGSDEARLDWVVATRYFDTGEGEEGLGAYYYEDFLGYRWGNDVIVFKASASYTRVGKWGVGCAALVMWKGAKDKWTVWTEENTSDDPADDNLPTSRHDERNYADPNASRRDAVNLISALSFSGKVILLPRLSVNGEIDLVLQGHPGNLSSNGPAFDAQFFLGLRYTLLGHDNV